jgi:glycosyltransferase involved in cell wall biosynthesis
MRIILVTDAWFPQVNGVVRTLNTLKTHLDRQGHDIVFITPQQFWTIPCPTYPEIPLALFPGRRMAKIIEQFRPCVVHLATEGPLGMAARSYCVKRDIPFTTAFHTKFPEYVHARFGIPIAWTYKLMRWFHGGSQGIMVATQTIEDELIKWGLTNIKRWTRGVDTELFKPRSKDFLDLPRPISLYVGRVAVEKNIEAFLKLDLPGSKVVVGDGPQLAELSKSYPDVHFVGGKQGDYLAKHFAAADVFVFPSRTDTFGLVLLEALASGIPVAAFPVPGPLDVIGDAPVGCLSEDLQQAVAVALKADPQTCRDYALGFSWETSVQQFLDNVYPFNADDKFPTNKAASNTPTEQTSAA